jgi:hypothetical protein
MSKVQSLRPIVRRVLRVGAGLALFLVAVVALALGFLHTTAGESRLRQRIEQRLGERVTTKAQLQGLSFSLARGLVLSGISIQGNDGQDAIVVERVAANLRWGKTFGGVPTLERLAVQGVRVNVVSKADGTNNLTGVFRERKPIEHLVLEKLSVSDVHVTLQKPDGTRIEVTNLSLDGDADVKPPEKTFEVGLTLAVQKLVVQKPGLRLEGETLGTKLRVGLRAGAGPVAVGPTEGKLLLQRPERADYAMVLGAPKVELNLAEGELTLVTEALKASALALASLRFEQRKRGDTLAGPQVAKIDGLVIDAASVNTLAGKRLLGGDITLAADVRGPAEAQDVNASAITPGGTITLKGRIDAVKKSASLALGMRDFDVNAAIVVDTVPKARIGELTVTAAGGGPDIEHVAGDLTIQGRDLVVRGISIDRLDATARYDEAGLKLKTFGLGALGQSLDASGTYNPRDKSLDLSFGTQGSVAETLAALRRAGIATPSSPALAGLSLGAPLRARVTGKTTESLTVHLDDVRLGALGGSTQARGEIKLIPGDVQKGEKRFKADEVHLVLSLRDVSLDRLGALRGRTLPVRGVARGEVRLDGPATAPDGKFDLSVAFRDTPTSPQKGTLSLAGTIERGTLVARTQLVSADGTQLLDGNARLGVSRAGVASFAPLQVRLHMPRQSLGKIGALLREEVAAKLPPADVALDMDLRGTPDYPTGTIHLDVDGPLLAARLSGKQQARIDVSLARQGAGTEAKLSAGASLNERPMATIAAVATLAGPTRAAASAPLRYDAKLKVDDLVVDDLPLLPEVRGKLGDLRAVVGAELSARGDRTDAFVDSTLRLRDVQKGALRNVGVDLRASVDAETSIRIDASHAGKPLGHLALRLPEVHGKDLFATVRALRNAPNGPDTALAGELVMVDQTLEGAVPLRLQGGGTIAGTLQNPQLDLGLKAAGMAMLDGSRRDAALRIRGGKETADLELILAEALHLHAKVSPAAYLKAKREGGDVPVQLSLRSAPTPLGQLIPNSPAIAGLKPQGAVSSDLQVDAVLAVSAEGATLGRLDSRGALELKDGSLRIPNAQRTMHGVALRIEGQGDVLRLATLEAHERDAEKADRSVRANGEFALRSRQAALSVALTDMLVFGGNFGEADAPRAAANGSLRVAADLSGPVRQVTVDVDALDLSSPDRYFRSHQQEVLSLGDVIELGPSGTSAEVGKLVRSGKEAERPSTQPQGDKTLEVRVRIPKPIHVKQRPLNLYAAGDVLIERYSDGRRVSGRLVCEKGDLLVGGKEHTLHHGEIRLSNDGAFLDLHFQREPDVAALRDFATAPGTVLYAHMVGPLGRQKLTFSGVSDGLFETLAMNNGRARVLTSPDAPASQTAQLPQVREIRQTAFMAAHLPHLAFMTRVNTLAEPYADRFAYGRFQRLEAERYDGNRRLRVTTRSPVIGQSDGEVEYDFLFRNTAREVSGVGILGGTRVGGGPTIFYEWSSAD